MKQDLDQSGVGASEALEKFTRVSDMQRLVDVVDALLDDLAQGTTEYSETYLNALEEAGLIAWHVAATGADYNYSDYPTEVGEGDPYWRVTPLWKAIKASTKKSGGVNEPEPPREIEPRMSALDQAFSSRCCGSENRTGSGLPTPTPEPGGEDDLCIKLRAIAVIARSWLDWNTEQRAKEGLASDAHTHIISPPTWPTHGMLIEWILAINSAIAALSALPRREEGMMESLNAAVASGKIKELMDAEQARVQGMREALDDLETDLRSFANSLRKDDGDARDGTLKVYADSIYILADKLAALSSPPPATSKEGEAG